MFAGKVHNLRHFGFRHFVCKDSAFAYTVLMHMHHDPVRRVVILVEEALQDMNHEFHRRVVVVEQQNTIKVRPLRLRPRLGNDRRPRCAVAFALAIVVREARRRSMNGNVNRRHWFVQLPKLANFHTRAFQNSTLNTCGLFEAGLRPLSSAFSTFGNPKSTQ